MPVDRNEYMRLYNEKNRVGVTAQRRAWYAANKARVNARRSELYASKRGTTPRSSRPKLTLEERREKQRLWWLKNPDKRTVAHAKSIIALWIGITSKDVPSDLATAKAAQLKVLRELKRRK